MANITDAAYFQGGAVSAMDPRRFDSVIAGMGSRVSWMKSHSCPCTFGGAGPNGELTFPGSAQRGCKRCLGLGTYWDDPSIPFMAHVKFVEMSPTPDEPGTRVNESFGIIQLAEPSLTLPFANPWLPMGDPQQPTVAWRQASTDDIFVLPDSLSRYTAKLQVGGIEFLPFQQNLQIEQTGAVTVWNPVTRDVEVVEHYAIDRASVTLGDVYPEGTGYMVEFMAAPMYVVFRPAGGLPHVRQFAVGTVNEPRRFKLQALDLWTRQRGQGPQAPGSTAAAGTLFPQFSMTGSLSNNTVSGPGGSSVDFTSDFNSDFA